MEDDNCAFNMDVVSNKFTNNVWVGDRGALCHMRSSLRGMCNLEPGSKGIKMGSRKVLKIVKIGKFKGKIIQKDGSTKIVVLNKVYFVPDMYCNLFSITSMDNGFSLTGRKDSFLTLQKKDFVIKFDHVKKSGGGKLVGVKMKHQDASKAHNILAHTGEAKTRATACKIGCTLVNKSITWHHCATAKAKIQTVAKMSDFPETHQGHMLALDISYVQHTSISGKQYWLHIHDIFTDMKWSYFLQEKSETNNFKVKIIWCDNAGESISLQKECKQDRGTGASAP